jgi:hypothetical protein
MIAFAPESDRRPWAGAVGRKNRFTSHHTTPRTCEWLRCVRQINALRQCHDLRRLADACERIASALEGER